MTTMKTWMAAAAIAVALCAAALPAAGQERSLVERLGFPKDAKVLIINADDFGMNSAGTQATIAGLRSGGLTSATVMVPCPWFPMVVNFAKENPQANIGVHTTLTSEWKNYKWGPVLGRTAVPSLVTEDGYFYGGVEPIYANAKLEEAVKEVRAQIQKAIDAGIDITHIDSHMGSMQYSPEYHAEYLKLAKEFNLPCRMASRDVMARFGAEQIVDMADEMDIVHPEYLFLNADPEGVENTAAFWTKLLKEQVKPGIVSEIYIHPGLLTPEMEATCGSWKQRTADNEFFKSPETIALIKSLGIELISYRELRELQRTGKPLPRVVSYAW